MTAGRLAKRAATIILAKLGEDVAVLDLRGRSPLADYFVIATASSSIHAQAIAEEVALELKREGERTHHVEGAENGLWILLDYFSVVVHIFCGETRQFFGLERLWGDAPCQTYTDTNVKS
ncbi:ribosome silencing factor [candidate division WOR-3 bacterium]|uniref:Ribosomal silencing factor RsfS n=1 Tax=candidate division WOR-3 bacterium TaxID=2052148 RepID=A0A937XF42_UNCW3|nr:ribosome silencing factor [candidate division WOR-3 bacterium]